MFRILFIVPYDAIQLEVDETIRKYQSNQIAIDTAHVIGVKETKKLKLDRYDLVIARGITYAALKELYPQKPLIEIGVTGFELIRAISEAKRRFVPDRIAVLGWKGMISSIRELSEVSSLAIECFEMNSDLEAKKQIESIKQRGIKVVVGGLTACKIASSMGLDSVFIKTGRETIEKTVVEALKTSKLILKEQNKSELLRMIMDYSSEAILSIDQQSKITTINKMAKRILGISPSMNVVGMPIDELIPDEGVSQILQSILLKDNIIQKYRGTLLNISSVPIEIKGEVQGAVKLFQKVTKIQEVEGEIRKTIHNKGLVAKYTFDSITGECDLIKEAVDEAYRYSRVDSNILLVGETGTGKELFAQSIHNESYRREGPFVAINCAALPENLLETELFGYVQGAFTGALKGGKIGFFELAHNGTVFLDEINEVSLSLQSKLLRVLEEKEIRRVGDERVIPVNVRIITAANGDLYKKVEKGEFRRDLLYRLNVLNIRIPALRNRDRDVLLLARYYLDKFSEKLNKPKILIDKATQEAFMSHDWPGNIRELKNICERLVVLSTGKEIVQSDFEKHISSKHEMIGVIEKMPIEKYPINHEEREENSLNVNEQLNRAIIEALKKSNNNRTLAAQMLGMSRSTLWRKLKELDV